MNNPAPEPLHRPVIVIGAPRSGTSVLAELLAVHPDVHYAEEPRLTWRIGNDARSDFLTPDDARPDVKKAIRDRFAEQVRVAGKTRLVEKTPSNALRLGFVNTIMPDAVFVHILREGYASVLSIRRFWSRQTTVVPMAKTLTRLKEVRLRQIPRYGREAIRRLRPQWMAGMVRPPVWGPRLPGIDQMVKEVDTLDIACLQWKMCVERACMEGRRLPPDRYLEVALDALDRPTLERLMTACGLPVSPRVLEAYDARFQAEHAARGLPEVDPGEMERMRLWLEPTVTWLASTSSAYRPVASDQTGTST